MSNFLLGLAGAAVGSVFGMPAVGFAVGSGLGATLGHHHHSSGHPPLARDLSVQTQEEGVGIPRVWGTVRLAGNVLWASKLVEIEGALYASLAIGLCEGPVAGLRRVWANEKEIFTLTAGSSALRSYYPKNFRFYPGSETQRPDPLIEARMGGKGSVPAFRGLAYIVLEQFPLAVFHNTMPTFTVEVVQSAVLLLSPAEKDDKSNTVIAPKDARIPMRRTAQKSEPLLSVPLPVPNPVPLATVVRDLCLAAGFPLESIDTTALLTASTVTGFVLASPISARAALQALQAVYGFVTVEVGGVLKAVLLKQGLLPLLLSTTDYGAQEESHASPVPLFWSRSPAAEIPSTLTLAYIDSLTGKTTSITARRSTLQEDSGCSEQLDVPLILTSLEAQATAERLLMQAETERLHVTFALPLSYTFLEPSDRVLIEDQVYRITVLEVGKPGIVRGVAVREQDFVPS